MVESTPAPMPEIALAAAAMPSLSRDELPPPDGLELATIPAAELRWCTGHLLRLSSPELSARGEESSSRGEKRKCDDDTEGGSFKCCLSRSLFHTRSLFGPKELGALARHVFIPHPAVPIRHGIPHRIIDSVDQTKGGIEQNGLVTVLPSFTIARLEMSNKKISYQPGLDPASGFFK